MATRRSAGALACVGLALALSAMTVGPGQAADKRSGSAPDAAEFYVVQGLPGTTLDVEVDGAVVDSDVAASEVVGPFDIEPGSRTMTFRDDGEVVLERTMDVDAASSTDLVVHLPSSTTEPPEVTVFDNDLSAVPRGKARLTVAHTAALAPADIRVDGRVLFANVANGESLTLNVPRGSYSVDIVPAGEKGPAIFGPVDVDIDRSALERVYAVGDPTADTMSVAVHEITTTVSGSRRPTEVNTGTGGQAVGLSPTLRTAWPAFFR